MENRIRQLIDYYKINTGQFEKKIGASNGQIYTLLSRGGSLNYATLVKILENCNEISPDWLLLGKGEMLRNSVDNSLPKEVYSVGDDHIQSLIDILNRTLSEKDKQIDRLLSIIEKNNLKNSL